MSYLCSKYLPTYLTRVFSVCHVFAIGEFEAMNRMLKSYQEADLSSFHRGQVIIVPMQFLRGATYRR